MRRARLWTREEAQAGNLGVHVAALGSEGVVPILTPGEIRRFRGETSQLTSTSERQGGCPC